jgi:hypothetical protein
LSISASWTSRGRPSAQYDRLRVGMNGLSIDPGRIVVELVSVPEVAPHAVSVRRRKPPWNSYEATTTAECVAQRALAEVEAVRLRERAPDPTRASRAKPSGARNTRSRPARTASTPPPALGR